MSSNDVRFVANCRLCPKCGLSVILKANDDTGLLEGYCPGCDTHWEKRPGEKDLRIRRES